MNSQLVEKHLLERSHEAGIKITQQRKTIIKALAALPDHPDIDAIYIQTSRLDPKISLATIYRTIKLFEDHNIVLRRDFGNERARYETDFEDHHDHLVDMDTGQVIEFQNKELAALQEEIALKLGYELVEHRLVLYGRKSK
ncbi:MAG: Fur family transcriptional regulator [Pseudomonadota bacterium]